MRSLRKLALWTLAILSGIATLYLGIMCVTSMLIGFRQVQTTGFWVPILAGSLSLVALLFLFLRIIRFIQARMKQEELINI